MSVELWQGEFGKRYTDRNTGDIPKLRKTFDRMLRGLDIITVLEVGCNKGHNLHAIRRHRKATGVEPNRYARAKAVHSGLTVYDSTITDLPFADDGFDLVFTAGVLIHVSPELIGKALAEVHRVAREYILAIEYWSPDETMIPWHGHNNILWKRDFRKLYEQFPDLTVIRSGIADPDLHPGCEWCLLRKS